MGLRRANMAEARAGEYRAVLAEARTAARAASTGDRRVVRRLRAELRWIGRRDYFPPPEREAAHSAVNALADDRAEEDTA